MTGRSNDDSPEEQRTSFIHGVWICRKLEYRERRMIMREIPGNELAQPLEQNAIESFDLHVEENLNLIRAYCDAFNGLSTICGEHPLQIVL